MMASRSIFQQYTQSKSNLILPCVYVLLVPFHSFMLSITSSCVSRIMLGVRSLTADLLSDPTLLLNNTELNRIPWHKGTTAGEFVVCAEDQMEARISNFDVVISTEVTIMEV